MRPVKFSPTIGHYIRQDDKKQSRHKPDNIPTYGATICKYI